METFFQMMAKYPEYLKQAHVEIDAFTTERRFITPQDRKYLPIIDCVLKEVLRYVYSNHTLLRSSLVLESTLPFLCVSIIFMCRIPQDGYNPVKGIPHAVMDEDEYRGMHIPSGSTIVPNIR